MLKRHQQITTGQHDFHFQEFDIAYIPFLFLNKGGVYYYRGCQDVRTERMTVSSFNIVCSNKYKI